MELDDSMTSAVLKHRFVQVRKHPIYVAQIKITYRYEHPCWFTFVSEPFEVLYVVAFGLEYKKFLKISNIH